MKLLLLMTVAIAFTSANVARIVTNFTVGTRKFAADLYKEYVKSERGSFVVSPFSVGILLGLFHSGAKGRTAEEISEALNLPADNEEVNTLFAAIALQYEYARRDGYTSGNKVYLTEGRISTATSNSFHVELENIDVSNPAASTAINQWVETKTQNKVTGLVQPADLRDSGSIAVAAIHFLGTWMQSFSPWDTKKRPFKPATGKEIPTEMMEVTSYFKYYESEDLNTTFLEMPYDGNHISMTLILPKNYKDMSILEENMRDVLSPPAYEHREVHVVLPKFKLETRTLFKPLLQTLGIQLPFTTAADFSGFNASGGLHIGQIIQKAVLEVKENGTTHVEARKLNNKVKLMTPRFDYEATLNFVADHPFIFYIKMNGMIAFVGKYVGIS